MFLFVNITRLCLAGVLRDLSSWLLSTNWKSPCKSSEPSHARTVAVVPAQKRRRRGDFSDRGSFFRFSSSTLLCIMPHWVPPVPLCSASQGEKSFAYESTGALADGPTSSSSSDVNQRVASPGRRRNQLPLPTLCPDRIKLARTGSLRWTRLSRRGMTAARVVG